MTLDHTSSAGMNRSQCADFAVESIVSMNGEGRFEDLRALLVKQLPESRRKASTSLLAEALVDAARNNRITKRLSPGADFIGTDRNARFRYRVDYGFKGWGYAYNGWPTQSRAVT